MKNALDMLNEVKAYENKKQRQEKQYNQDLMDARKGIVNLSFWEKYVLLPRFKRHLQKECQPMFHGGKYYVHPFLCGVYSRQWSEHWLQYGAFLLEQAGYLEVEVQKDKVLKSTYIRAILPASATEQILFAARGNNGKI